MGKLIVFTAPSGAGKTTIVRHLLQTIPNLSFSISATTRQRRPKEREQVDYYFLTVEDFQQKIKEQAFIEWEEVYTGQYYGTLKSEVERLWGLNQHIIFDIDVQGALNVKKAFPERTLTIFIKTPTLEILFERLKNRDTENSEQLKRRMDKARQELKMEDQFDQVLINDQLEESLTKAENIVRAFITD